MQGLTACPATIPVSPRRLAAGRYDDCDAQHRANIIGMRSGDS